MDRSVKLQRNSLFFLSCLSSDPHVFKIKLTTQAQTLNMLHNKHNIGVIMPQNDACHMTKTATAAPLIF